MSKAVQMALQELSKEIQEFEEVQTIAVIRKTKNAIDYLVFNPDGPETEE